MRVSRTVFPGRCANARPIAPSASATGMRRPDQESRARAGRLRGAWTRIRRVGRPPMGSQLAQPQHESREQHADHGDGDPVGAHVVLGVAEVRAAQVGQRVGQIEERTRTSPYSAKSSSLPVETPTTMTTAVPSASGGPARQAKMTPPTRPTAKATGIATRSR